MTRVHSHAGFSGGHGAERPPPSKLAETPKEEAVLTDWKNLCCSTVKVIDGKGDLVFREDNYMQGNKGSILLMDPEGKPLLTIRRKKMSLALGLGENWLVYDGEQTTATPRFSVKKSFNILNNTCLAYFIGGDGNDRSHRIVYEIEGSYPQTAVCRFGENRRLAAEISGKRVVEGLPWGPMFSFLLLRLIIQGRSLQWLLLFSLIKCCSLDSFSTAINIIYTHIASISELKLFV